MQEKIVFADDMLVKNAVAKIDDGDVILTYGYSSTVFAIFMQAQQVRSLPPSVFGQLISLGRLSVQYLTPETGAALSEFSLRLLLPAQCLHWCGLGLVLCPGMSSASRPCTAGWQALQSGGGRCAAPS